jgi:hypothetical protein
MQVLTLTSELVSELSFFAANIIWDGFVFLLSHILDVVTIILISLQNKAEGMILSLLVMC